MARPRLPTKIQELKGAFRKNPSRGRARQNEPQPVGEVGAPPEYFDDEHIAIWNEFVAEAAPGVLTVSDRKILELAVRLTLKARITPGRRPKWLSFLSDALLHLGMPEEDVAKMQEAFKTAMSTSTPEQMLLKSCLGSMGMTPADRAKIAVPKQEKTENRFSRLAQVVQIQPK